MIILDEKLINSIATEAKTAARKRKNYNFHKEMSDTLQRMLHALEPDTYVQPHKHENPDKREVFIILKGKVAAIQYTPQGEIANYVILDREAGNYGVEFEERSWHSLICLETSSVLYEVKDGPYDVTDDKNFASWAPKEGDADCMQFINKILKQITV